MEEEIQEVVVPTCPNCSTEIQGNPEFCVNCGFPLNGTEKEQSKFYAQQAMTRSKVKAAPKQIRAARNTLFIVGGINLAVGIFYFFAHDLMEQLIAGGIIFLIYLGLGFWSQTKPLIALILGLLVYVSFIILAAILNPASIVSGIIWKVIIIAYLAKGINSARELQKQQQI